MVLRRAWKVTLPDSTSTSNDYHPTGQLKKTYGSHTYPIEYTYDSQGRMQTMKTGRACRGPQYQGRQHAVPPVCGTG